MRALLAACVLLGRESQAALVLGEWLSKIWTTPEASDGTRKTRLVAPRRMGNEKIQIREKNRTRPAPSACPGRLISRCGQTRRVGLAPERSRPPSTDPTGPEPRA